MKISIRSVQWDVWWWLIDFNLKIILKKENRDILSLNEDDVHQHALIDRYRHLILLTDMIDDKELME